MKYKDGINIGENQKDELVLKIYANQNIKSFNRELDVFRSLVPPQVQKVEEFFDKEGKLIGFP